ncbi:MAG: putative F420-dependent oxidoreductase [Acidimicrobiia bacterium]|nr:putative F420-dependent oxidoreductase [Acidimicrobiia bacterium]
MHLGANVGGSDPQKLIDFAQFAEGLGVHSLWCGEAYGGDAVVPLAWAAAHTSRIKLGTAILQMPGRTPAMTAMTALSFDQLSGGRLILGLGMSGPQVVEGWHGRPYVDPLGTTEEYVAILRRIFQGADKVTFDGRHFQLPYHGPDGTGVGKAMRPGLHTRPDLPIFVAAIGPKNIALTTRVADGLLPMLWNPYRVKEALGSSLAGALREGFTIAPTVPVVVGDDVAACRDKVKPLIGLYVGGMGAKGKNFYNTLVCRYGYEEAAGKIQAAYLEGRRAEAIAMVPDELVDELALVGPKERIAERIEPWKQSGTDLLIVSGPTRTSLTVLAELLL